MESYRNLLETEEFNLKYVSDQPAVGGNSAVKTTGIHKAMWPSFDGEPAVAGNSAVKTTGIPEATCPSFDGQCQRNRTSIRRQTTTIAITVNAANMLYHRPNRLVLNEDSLHLQNPCSTTQDTVQPSSRTPLKRQTSAENRRSTTGTTRRSRTFEHHSSEETANKAQQRSVVAPVEWRKENVAPQEMSSSVSKVDDANTVHHQLRRLVSSRGLLLRQNSIQNCDTVQHPQDQSSSILSQITSLQDPTTATSKRTSILDFNDQHFRDFSPADIIRAAEIAARHNHDPVAQAMCRFILLLCIFCLLLCIHCQLGTI